jgi:hypothetical protein
VRISVLINGIDINALEAGPFSCDPQILMETLLINIRNEVASHQAFMGLKVREKLLWLQKELTTLKENVVLNELQILDLKKKLNGILDAELRKELESFRQYDIINTEKMTPRFLSLCKTSKKKRIFRYDQRRRRQRLRQRAGEGQPHPQLL